jgi:hypothetical protein
MHYDVIFFLVCVLWVLLVTEFRARRRARLRRYILWMRQQAKDEILDRRSGGGSDLPSEPHRKPVSGLFAPPVH